MILYIDETEHEDFFIVAGLLVESEPVVDLAYKRFKKSIKNYPMNNKAKESVFVEFKSTLIDNRFQKIKINLLKHLGEIEGKILFSYYEKKQKNMKESLKESIYITLLINMVNSIEESIDIIFDCFGNKQFENNIIETLIVYNSVKSIKPCDSQEMPGLQFVDNVCSVIRLHLTQHDKENYYSYIEKMIERV